MKFRAYIKTIDTILYDITIHPNDIRVEIKGCKRYIDKEDYVLELGCEINGTFIYEGDLIESKAIVDGKESISKLPVVFDNGAFYLDESFKKDGTYLTLLNEFDEKLKVIGNIHKQ